MDYRDLLRRYIEHVVSFEGTAFVGMDPERPDEGFTVEEWRELHLLAYGEEAK